MIVTEDSEAAVDEAIEAELSPAAVEADNELAAVCTAGPDEGTAEETTAGIGAAEGVAEGAEACATAEDGDAGAGTAGTSEVLATSGVGVEGDGEGVSGVIWTGPIVARKMLVELIADGLFDEAEDDATAFSVLEPFGVEAAGATGAAAEPVCFAPVEVRLVDGSGLMTRYVCVAVTVVASRSVIVVLVRAMMVAAGKVIVAWVAALPPSTGTTEYFALRATTTSRSSGWLPNGRASAPHASTRPINTVAQSCDRILNNVQIIKKCGGTRRKREEGCEEIFGDFPAGEDFAVKS